MHIDSHGSKWIAKINGIQQIKCPECNSNQIESRIQMSYKQDIDIYTLYGYCENCKCNFHMEATENDEVNKKIRLGMTARKAIKELSFEYTE